MCLRRMLMAMVLAIGAAGLSMTAAAEEDQVDAAQLLAQGAVLPLDRFIDRARTLRPGRLIDAHLRYEETHRAYVYELEILDPSGVVWEVEFDAASGALLELGPGKN